MAQVTIPLAEIIARKLPRRCVCCGERAAVYSRQRCCLLGAGETLVVQAHTFFNLRTGQVGLVRTAVCSGDGVPFWLPAHHRG